MSEWITFSAAAQYLLAHHPFESLRDACEDLNTRILKGEISTRYNEAEVAKDSWKLVARGWHTETYTTVGDDDISSHMVELRRESLEAICPIPRRPQKHPGGAPTKYDYEGGLIYLARVCLETPIQKIDEDLLVRSFGDWMAQHYTDGGPDPREIRKRAKRFYDEAIAVEG